MQQLRPAIVLIAHFTLLTGVAFPLVFVGVGRVAFPFQAGGSLVRENGQVIGSALLGQDFSTPRYFHPRPSATTEPDPKDASKTVPAPYAADNSAASNLGPTSKALIERVTADVKALGTGPVPADAVTTSASGLDPDISPENAALQVPRVANARNLPEATVRDLVAAYTTGRIAGFIGEPRVNVLALNLALDAQR
ncbi:MAG: potassium-transporting ATPase subunit KdpC [Acetobacteraceae bacterium]